MNFENEIEGLRSVMRKDNNLSEPNMSDCMVCGIWGLCGPECPIYGSESECPKNDNKPAMAESEE